MITRKNNHYDQKSDLQNLRDPRDGYRDMRRYRAGTDVLQCDENDHD